MRFGASYLYRNDLSWAGRLGFWFHGFPFIGSFLRSLYFRKAIRGRSYTDILDAGCGAGEYSFYLAARYPKSHVIGIDLNKATLDINAKVADALRLDNVRFLKKDLHKLTESGVYDLIVSVDVLDRVKENHEVLALFSLQFFLPLLMFFRLFLLGQWSSLVYFLHECFLLQDM